MGRALNKRENQLWEHQDGNSAINEDVKGFCASSNDDPDRNSRWCAVFVVKQLTGVLFERGRFRRVLSMLAFVPVLQCSQNENAVGVIGFGSL